MARVDLGDYSSGSLALGFWHCRTQLLPQDPQRVVRTGERGALRDSQSLRRFLGGAAIQVHLLQHIPVTGAEPGKYLLDVHRGHDRLRMVLKEPLGRAVLCHLCGPRPAHPGLVDHDIVRHPDQPGTHRALVGGELVAVPPRAQHRLLNDIFGQVLIPQQSGDVAEHVGTVLAVELADLSLGLVGWDATQPRRAGWTHRALHFSRAGSLPAGSDLARFGAGFALHRYVYESKLARFTRVGQ